MKCR
ncbi:Protein of unknown function [Lactobacillus delbrueckii subsp. bulgaricus]|jgi:hypothetical protein